MQKTFVPMLTLVAILNAAEDVYVDKQSGLMWQNDSDVGTVQKAWLNRENCMRCCLRGDQDSCGDSGGDTAEGYCQDLNLGGYDDWRLPTAEELILFGHSGFSDWKIPIINVPQEPDKIIREGSFWSATSAQYKGKPRKAAYTVMFAVTDGNAPEISTFTRDKNHEQFVRCVRGKSTRTPLR